MNKRKLYYLLSPSLRRFVRRLYYLPVDIFDRITGKRDKITPPKGKIFIGSGDFLMQGERLLNILIQYGGLKPYHRVLDVGSGIGRLAIPLTKYLDSKGSYEGFDIVEAGICWCNKKITPQHHNFKFLHIDLKNDLYNLRTNTEAKNFIFPYNDNDFDLVFLFSVFTHMLPEDVDNYLKQIRRVLKKGGTCLATFFVHNKEIDEFMSKNDGLKFNYDYGNYLLFDPKVKEANVAFRESFLKQLIEKNNLSIEQVNYGFWSGREKSDCIDFQDTIILKKQ
jgi:SAM-dependent methyltransferase